MKLKRLAFILSLSWIISGYVLGQVRVIDNVDGRIVSYAQIMDMLRLWMRRVLQ